MPKRKKYRRLKERIWKPKAEHYDQLPHWVLIISLEDSHQLSITDRRSGHDRRAML